jgi:hypothetical protein
MVKVNVHIQELMENIILYFISLFEVLSSNTSDFFSADDNFKILIQDYQ